VKDPSADKDEIKKTPPIKHGKHGRCGEIILLINNSLLNDITALPSMVDDDNDDSLITHY
jgi:hypothetical protein